MLVTGSSDLKFCTFPSNGFVDSFKLKPNACVESLSWSRTNVFLVYVERDSRPEILSFKDSNQARSIHAITAVDHVTYATFSHRRNRIIALGTGCSTVALYDTQTKSIAKLYDVAQPVLALDYSCTDEKLIVACQEGVLVILDMQNECPPQTRYLDSNIVRLHTHPSRLSIFGVCTQNGTFHLFDLEPVALKWSVAVSVNNKLNDFAFSPLLTSADLVTVDEEHRMTIYNWSTGQCTYRCAMPNALTAIDYSEDGEHFAVGMSDGRVVVFRAQSPRTPTHTLKLDTARIRCLKFSGGTLGPPVEKPVTVWVAPGVRNKRWDIPGTPSEPISYETQALRETFEVIADDLSKYVSQLNTQFQAHMTNLKDFIRKEFDKIAAQTDEKWDMMNIIRESCKVDNSQSSIYSLRTPK